jgi:hypothetical protein
MNTDGPGRSYWIVDLIAGISASDRIIAALVRAASLKTPILLCAVRIGARGGPKSPRSQFGKGAQSSCERIAVSLIAPQSAGLSASVCTDVSDQIARRGVGERHHPAAQARQGPAAGAEYQRMARRNVHRCASVPALC